MILFLFVGFIKRDVHFSKNESQFEITFYSFLA